MATSKSTKKTAKRGPVTRSATRKTGGTNSRSSSSEMEEDNMSTGRIRTTSSNQSGKTRTPTNITGFGSKPASRTKSSDDTSTGSKSGGSKSKTSSNRGSRQMQTETNERNEKKPHGNISRERNQNQSDWREDRHTGNRGNMYPEDEYRRSSRGDDRYREDYYGDRQMRSNYESDRNSGRHQERYSDNERNAQRDRSGRYDQQENLYRNSGSGRAAYSDNRGNQQYYDADERRSQRSQGWTPYNQQMETYNDRRPAGYGRNRRTIPTGKNDEGLRKLFTDQLKDIYWAEKALTKAIPKMIKKASGRELIHALNEHLYVTEDQVQKLESVFRLMGQKPTGKKCEAMEGLIKEAEEIIKDMEAGSVRDAGIICAGQKVEHYEIATYGCLSTYAEILGEMEMVDILEEILAEEKRADKTLTQVATRINWEAAVEEDEEFEEDVEDAEEEEEEKEEEEEEEEEEDDEDYIQDAKKSPKS